MKTVTMTLSEYQEELASVSKLSHEEGKRVGIEIVYQAIRKFRENNIEDVVDFLLEDDCDDDCPDCEQELHDFDDEE